MWVDMKDCGVDDLISAPKKAWSASPCAGIVMMNNAAMELLEKSDSTSFALNLKTWVGVMNSYTNGGHSYHAIMPTDSLKEFRNAINEAAEY